MTNNMRHFGAVLIAGCRDRLRGARGSTRVGVTTAAAVILINGLAAAPAAGQVGPYQLEEGDTLRFAEITESTLIAGPEESQFVVESTHDALIAMVHAEPGILAWYEKLYLLDSGPEGESDPTTDELLGKPFSLDSDGSGRLVTRAVPEIPPEVAESSDLRLQFTDFWVPLPASRPADGTVWSDSLHSGADDALGGDAVRSQWLTLKIRGDTTVNGVTATVVEVQQEVQMESVTQLDESGITHVQVTLAGTEEGIVIFDFVRGQLLYRQKAGNLQGTATLFGGPEPYEMPQSFSYTSSITAVR